MKCTGSWQIPAASCLLNWQKRTTCLWEPEGSPPQYVACLHLHFDYLPVCQHVSPSVALAKRLASSPETSTQCYHSGGAIFSEARHVLLGHQAPFPDHWFCLQAQHQSIAYFVNVYEVRILAAHRCHFLTSALKQVSKGFAFTRLLPVSCSGRSPSFRNFGQKRSHIEQRTTLASAISST